MILGLLLLAVTALGLRAAAAVLRAPPARLAWRLPGWLLAAVAAWLVAGAAGAWAPLWPVLLAAAAFALLDRRGRPLALWAGADVLLVTGLGLLSIPTLAPPRIAAAALVLAAAGLVLDLAAGRLPAALHRVARWATAPAMVGLAAFLVLALVPPASESRPTALTATLSLNSGVMLTALPGTQRITLDTGAAAWLDRPRGHGPFPGALFFHGADARASHQPSALAARRALVAAGYKVLAVDHPGYGESPHAPLDADVAVWDPLPSDLAAYEALRALPAVRGITVVGHSMGNNDLLRLLVAGVPLDAAVMLGAALPDPEGDPEYLYERFLDDRGIGTPMDSGRVHEIRARYYDAGRYARELPPSHPPVHFVSFDIEWPDVAAMRDALYDLVPERRTAWRIRATHYLSARNFGRLPGLVIGDTRASRELIALLKAVEQEAAAETAAGGEARR